MKSYAWLMTDAFKADAHNPAQLLVLAVVARWVEDRRRDPSIEIGEEWIELAGVPRSWMPT
jgi:hypothetical protein